MRPGHDKESLQRPFPVYRKLGALDHGRGDPQSRRSGKFPRVFSRKPTEGPSAPLYARLVAQVAFRRERCALEKLA